MEDLEFYCAYINSLLIMKCFWYLSCDFLLFNLQLFLQVPLAKEVSNLNVKVRSEPP